LRNVDCGLRIQEAQGIVMRMPSGGTAILKG